MMAVKHTTVLLSVCIVSDRRKCDRNSWLGCIGMGCMGSSRSSHSTINDMCCALLMMLSLLCCVDFTLGQCPIGTTMSFEKISSVTIRGVPLLPLYSGQHDIPVTAECNNRCRAGPKCRAFLINYDKHMCTGMDYDSQNRGASIVSTLERTSYFEKICLSTAPCEKAWTFERVIGRELHGFDDRVLNGVASRLRCQELCLKETSFACRSGEYDYALQQCRLSSEDRRSQTQSYKLAISTVDYFENQCASLSSGPSCDFEKQENVDLRRADLIRTAFSAEQCRHLCDATRAFVCRSFTYVQKSAQCWLSSDDILSTSAALSTSSTSSLDTHQYAQYYQRTHCLDLQLFCNHDSMTVSLNTMEPFHGKLYSKDEPIACESLGRSTTNTLLTMPFNPRTTCGIRQDSGKYSSLVVIQHHPLIQRKGDRMVQLTCHFETINRTITNSYNVVVESAAVAETAIVNATASSPNIRLRITDRQGLDIVGARLGDELYLRIELDDDSVFGIFARDLMAKSGKTDEAITLIDSDGCPTDTNIFPALSTISGTKALQGKFDAFKFADDVVVRFQVNVQFCIEHCIAVDCTQHSPHSPLNAPFNHTIQSNTTANSKSFGRRRRKRTDDDSFYDNNTLTTPSTLLPDYPLQREIIVEGISVKSTRQPSIRPFNDNDSAPLFCTSRTTLMAALVTIVTLQLTIVGSCCACFVIYKRPHNCCSQSSLLRFCDSSANQTLGKDQESVTTTISSSPQPYYNFQRVANHQSNAGLWSAMSRIE